MGKYVYVVMGKHWISGMSSKGAYNQFFYIRKAFSNVYKL